MDPLLCKKPAESQIIGQYRIGETIGKGSFGKVKKGVHVPTGETVAIKILNRKKLKNANMDKKIFREIKILKLFSHPNICRLYEVISTPTDIYLFLEYVEGGELFDYIVKKGTVSEDLGRYILQQIVCALEYCHHFLVVHRDLKPENILLGPGLQVKLIDFGLSNIMKDGEFLATSCGSPNYAAPEVISGKLYFGPEVDVWSCGVILYALLCGCLPFDEESIPLLFSKIKKGLYQIPSYVSRGARELIQQILVVDPLLRLTIPQIRDNVWFNTNLPMRLLYNEMNFLVGDKRILPTVVSRAAKLLNMRDRDVRSEIEAACGPGYVAYNILFDKKQREEIFKEAGPLIVSGNLSKNVNGLTSNHMCKAMERELNLGLLLTQSPAMEALLDKFDASSNKHTYNKGNFIPASLHEAKTLAASINTNASNGVFSISKRLESCVDASHPFGSFTFQSSSSLHRSSTYGASMRIGSAGVLDSSQNEHHHVGSVARSCAIYTQEQEEFIVNNNVGWRIGLMSDFSSTISQDAIYKTLKRFDMEWKVLAPFHLLARTTPATWAKIGLSSINSQKSFSLNSLEANGDDPKALTGVTTPRLPVVLDIHLFRMHEKHCDGYLVDFGVVRGSFCALDVVLQLSTTLIHYVG